MTRKKVTLYLCILLTNLSFPLSAQIDPDASDETVILYGNLKKIQNSSFFLFGQEFFNSFQYNSSAAHGDEMYSDSHAVTGSHPAVLGSDFHYYLEKNETERSYHTEAVKWAFQQGYVITFDWHITGKNTADYQYYEASKDLVDNIVSDPEGEDRAWLLAELDKVIAIINNDLVVDGTRIPIVFRPWHEMNGGWFWWGSRSTSPANYKAFYQLTVDYMKERTSSVLYCWSPNYPTDMAYYPGDEYVDILGLDMYEINVTAFRQNIAPIVDHAQANDKVAVFSETGARNVPADSAAMYWEKKVLPAITQDPSGKAIKIAWVLTWINASWSVPYVPHPSSSAAAKQSFLKFKNSSAAVFGEEMQGSIYTPWTITIAEETPYKEALVWSAESGALIIKVNGTNMPCRVSIYDLSGALVNSFEMISNGFSLSFEDALPSGLYVVRVTDFRKVISRKIVVE